ncbi:MAG: biopolymer transporter ExbD [Phycisphaerales bacterium]|nr:MAG: biopolymer transporter ExbD [Phycisphaerales bacterium]
MRLRKRKHEYGSQINIAPLIDVVFLLIIFFLTVSHITQVKVEPLPLPEAEEGHKPEEQGRGRIIINVHKDGRISGNVQSIDSLQQVLMEEIRRSGKGNLSILLRGDRATSWRKISEIMQICTSNGINRISVAVTEPGGSSL